MKMIASGLTLAGLGAIDSLLTSLVADNITRTQHKSGRELIGQGSTFVLYAAIIGLILYGNRDPERIGSLLRSRWAASFLGMCFVCYLSSQLLDRGIVKRIGWLIFWDTSWELPYSSTLEEALESLGGFFLLCTPFAVKAGRMANLSRSNTMANTQI